MAEHVLRLRELVGGDELLQLPSVSVALRDDQGRVLLGRHTEGDIWLLPGGAIEPGEVPADAAVREMWEETGFVVRLTGLVGVFGGPEFIVRYRNADRTSYVMTVFEAALIAGAARPDRQELIELRYLSEMDAGSLRTPPWMGEVLHALFHVPRAHAFRPATWRPPGTR